ncbi:MAG: class I SAM-dependent methyltransferase [Myxococcota bacterium]|nr:class I SAM-dependent methyltransferase [Myxococcota bacterium]
MAELDLGKVEERIGAVFGKAEGALTCALGMIGDRLGLYAAIAEAGPVTSQELADKTSLHERWLREWLQQQAASGLIDHEGGRFHLTPEAEQILAREDSPFFAGGVFGEVVGMLGTLEGLEESFRTGIGAPYDSFGREVAIGIERTLAPFFRSRLVPEVLPLLEGVVPKLEAGARVADVGCGAGLALVAMAKAFPDAELHGYDNSRMALARAEGHKKDAGVANLTFHETTHERLPEDESFDLITTFDCIHDMTHPTDAIRAIRRSLKPDGTWFVADIHGHASFEENLEKQPLSAMLYGFSVVCCMRAALSVPGGEGLGTLGFTETVARRMSEEAGFTRFQMHDLGNPLNDYYEIRP